MTEPSLKQKLLSAADNWAARTGLSLARLGHLTGRDGKFFDRLRAGSDCGTATYEKIVAFIDSDLADRARRGKLDTGAAA